MNYIKYLKINYAVLKIEVSKVENNVYLLII